MTRLCLEQFRPFYRNGHPGCNQISLGTTKRFISLRKNSETLSVMGSRRNFALCQLLLLSIDTIKSFLHQHFFINGPAKSIETSSIIFTAAEKLTFLMLRIKAFKIFTCTCTFSASFRTKTQHRAKGPTLPHFPLYFLTAFYWGICCGVKIRAPHQVQLVPTLVSEQTQMGSDFTSNSQSP